MAPAFLARGQHSGYRCTQYCLCSVSSPSRDVPEQARTASEPMAAAYPIPSFLQLPIEGVADDEADSTERSRPRDAALARSGSLRLTHPVRLAPGADDADPASTSRAEAAAARAPADAAQVLAAVANRGGDERPSAFDREAAI